MDTKVLLSIIENLRKSKKINSYDSLEEREADTVAHALLDMLESFKTVSNFVTKLNESKLTEEEVDELLLDVGEELRHIIYHVDDMKFYSYLKAE